ncbi:MAG: protein kinase [Bacteroidota bacterium]|nr:protein kinase [Bacteroidota bacterium]
MKLINGKYQITKVLKKKTNNKITYLGNRVGESKYLILKAFNCNNESSYLSWLREKNIDFTHSNLNKLVDFFKYDNYCYIVREYVEGLDSWRFVNSIYNRKKYFNEKLLIKLTIDLLDGINVLHDESVIHRDIRPQNILFKQSSESKKIIEKAVLTDFELAKLPKMNKIDSYAPFSFVFSPPEQVLRFNSLLNQSSDLYALGVSLWALLTKKLPFNHHVPEIITNIQIAIPIPKNRKISSNLMDIIIKSTIKPKFITHPNKIPKNDLKYILQSAQNKRYISALDMKKDLLSIL